MRKLKNLILILVCATLLFTSCGCSENSYKVLKEEAIIAEDGKFLYHIISAKADAENDTVVDEAKNLKNQIITTFDIAVNSNTDDKEKASDENYEILLGNTNREESKNALKIISEKRINNTNDWGIKVIGNKICVVAISDEKLPEAIRYFNTTFCTNIADFSKLGKDFEYVDMQKYEGEGATIADVSFAKWSVVTTKEKSLVYADEVNTFLNNIKEKYGYNIESVRDDKQNERKYEILIGSTNRAASKAVQLSKNQWIISQVDDKLVVNGGNNEAIAAALSELIKMDEQALANKEPFTIKKGFKKEGTVTKNDIDYYLSWSDEFDGPFNRNIWRNAHSADGTKTEANCMGGTNYLRDSRYCYTQNSDLVLTSKRLNATDWQNASTTTYGTLAARYGIIEIRAKLPPAPYAVSFWGGSATFNAWDGVYEKVTTSKPDGNMFELDILENFGKVNSFASNLHLWWNDGNKHSSLDGTKYGKAKIYALTDGSSFADDYHIFAIEWTPEIIRFAVDGDVYFEYDLVENNGDGFRAPIRLHSTIGFGKLNYGPQYFEEGMPEQAELRIDYWRIYQTNQYDNIMWVYPQEPQTFND